MEVMASSSLRPEEAIRRTLLSHMVRSLGFPQGLIVVEKELKELPHLSGQIIPKRRLDILCYRKDFSPLLVIECKAVPLTQKVIDQVVGYNYYVQAEYVAIANGALIKWAHKSNYHFTDGLPSYDDLVR